MPSLPASPGLASSGFLAVSTFLGAAIIARMAAASASAALRRLSSSAVRCFSAASTSAALTTRSAGLGGGAGSAGAAAGAGAGAAAGARAAPAGGHAVARRGRFGRSLGGRGRGLLLGGLAARCSAASRSRALLLLALAALLGQLFFLAAQQLGLAARLVLAALELGLVDHRRGRRGRFLGRAGASSRLTNTRFLRTSTWIVRALPDASACLISLVVLRVSVIFLRSPPAVPWRDAQVVEQPLLVGVGQRVVGRTLADAGGLQLLEQRRRRAVQLGGELGDGGHGHVWVPCVLCVCCSAVRR